MPPKGLHNQSESQNQGKGKVKGKMTLPSAAHTVRESVRMNFTRDLMRLRESDTETSITFPGTLSNTERKFLHALAEELGMKSKSTGSKKVEGARVITISKQSDRDDTRQVANTEILLTAETVAILRESFSGPDIVYSAAQKAPEPSLRESAERVVGGKSFASKQSFFTPLTDELEFLSQNYLRAQAERIKRDGFLEMQERRSQLPAHQHREAVCTLIKQHQIILVSGETGCGKTTQVPQFLLDDPEIGPSCKMVVTQPRRLSAMAVSSRIAAERSWGFSSQFFQHFNFLMNDHAFQYQKMN